MLALLPTSPSRQVAPQHREGVSTARASHLLAQAQLGPTPVNLRPCLQPWASRQEHLQGDVSSVP